MPLPELLVEILETRTVTRVDGGTQPLMANVTLEEAQRLYDVVTSLSPAVAIEIGCAHGISTLALAQAMHDVGGELHVMDPFQDGPKFAHIGFANVERAGLTKNVQTYVAYPEMVVPGLPRAQFAFIDASHKFDLTMVDYVLVDKRLDVGGVIAFHDLWMPALRKVLRYILTNREYEVYEPTSVPSSRRQRVESLASLVPGLRSRLKPEVTTPFRSLGLAGSNVGLIRKVAEDATPWDYFREF